MEASRPHGSPGLWLLISGCLVSVAIVNAEEEEEQALTLLYEWGRRTMARTQRSGWYWQIWLELLLMGLCSGHIKAALWQVKRVKVPGIRMTEKGGASVQSLCIKVVSKASTVNKGSFGQVCFVYR